MKLGMNIVPLEFTPRECFSISHLQYCKREGRSILMWKRHLYHVIIASGNRWKASDTQNKALIIDLLEDEDLDDR
jgi:hypothetical protein